jgi:hypothetical protein
MLSVQDEGIGMTPDRMARLNARLAEFDPETPYDQEGDEGLGLGLYVVARLAHRHGVRVQLRDQKQGGVTAVVVLPKPLLSPAPTTAVPSSATSPVTHTFSLPGADAEANSNVLHGRSTDPLVALAEQAVQDKDAEEDPEPAREEPAPARQEWAPAREESAAAREEPAQHPAETTMELLLPPRPAEPDPTHTGPGPQTDAPVPRPAPAADGFTPQGPPAPDHQSRTGDADESGVPGGEAEETHEHTPDVLTSKGLPKRTPKISAPTAPPRQRTSSVDAEALRRRLGGFRRGAQAGYRDVAAEIAEETGQTRTPATGGTVEEASS